MISAIERVRSAIIVRLAVIAVAAVLAVLAWRLLPVQAITQRDVLIKASDAAAVYYLANDGKRYVFPTFGAFRSWFSDFDEVNIVPRSELTSYPLGGNVTYRPGVRLVKIRTDAKVYAVDKGGQLRWITSEAIARRLYGSDWNKKIDDVPDSFFVNYKAGDPIYTDSDFDPVGAAAGATTVGEDKSLAVSQGADKSDTAPNTGDAAAIRGTVTGTNGCLGDVWKCLDWQACAENGSQVRTCTRTFDCAGVEATPPAASRACSVAGNACTADTWSCGDWGACSSGTKTRSCTKTFECDKAVTESPATSEACTVETPAETPACTADTWSCIDWSACGTAEEQNRTCSLTVDCPGVSTPSPAIVRVCEPGTGPSLLVGASDAVATSTNDAGDTDVPVFAFTFKPRGATMKLWTINFMSYVDENGDGVFSKGYENETSFDDVLSGCGVYDGDDKLGSDLFLTATGGGIVALTGLVEDPYQVGSATTRTLIVKCDVIGPPGSRAALALHAGPDAIGATYRPLMVSQVPNGPTLGDVAIDGLPINATGSSEPTVQVKVRVPEVTGPTIAPAALPDFTLKDGAVVASRLMIIAGSGAVGLRRVTVDVEVATVTGAITLEPTSDSSMRVVGTDLNIPGTVTMLPDGNCAGIMSGTCRFRVDFQEPLVVPDGGLSVLDLRLNVIGSSSGESLSSGVIQELAFDVPDSLRNVLWSEAELTGNTYVVSSVVEHGAVGIPTDFQTLSR